MAAFGGLWKAGGWRETTEEQTISDGIESIDLPHKDHRGDMKGEKNEKNPSEERKIRLLLF